MDSLSPSRSARRRQNRRRNRAESQLSAQMPTPNTSNTAPSGGTASDGATVVDSSSGQPLSGTLNPAAMSFTPGGGNAHSEQELVAMPSSGVEDVHTPDATGTLAEDTNNEVSNSVISSGLQDTVGQLQDNLPQAQQSNMQGIAGQQIVPSSQLSLPSAATIVATSSQDVHHDSESYPRFQPYTADTIYTMPTIPGSSAGPMLDVATSNNAPVGTPRRLVRARLGPNAVRELQVAAPPASEGGANTESASADGGHGLVDTSSPRPRNGANAPPVAYDSINIDTSAVSSTLGGLVQSDELNSAEENAVNTNTTGGTPIQDVMHEIERLEQRRQALLASSGGTSQRMLAPDDRRTVRRGDSDQYSTLLATIRAQQERITGVPGANTTSNILGSVAATGPHRWPGMDEYIRALEQQKDMSATQLNEAVHIGNQLRSLLIRVDGLTDSPEKAALIATTEVQLRHINTQEQHWQRREQDLTRDIELLHLTTDPSSMPDLQRVLRLRADALRYIAGQRANNTIMAPSGPETLTGYPNPELGLLPVNDTGSSNHARQQPADSNTLAHQLALLPRDPEPSSGRPLSFGESRSVSTTTSGETELYARPAAHRRAPVYTQPQRVPEYVARTNWRRQDDTGNNDSQV